LLWQAPTSNPRSLAASPVSRRTIQGGQVSCEPRRVIDAAVNVTVRTPVFVLPALSELTEIFDGQALVSR
jgi:hypothetical protein